MEFHYINSAFGFVLGERRASKISAGLRGGSLEFRGGGADPGSEAAEDGPHGQICVLTGASTGLPCRPLWE